MKVSVKVEKEFDIKKMRLELKVTDGFCASFFDKDGYLVYTQEEGYVPNFMPGQHYGDYVMLDIDIDTGQITNWKKSIATELEEFINENI